MDAVETHLAEASWHSSLIRKKIIFQSLPALLEPMMLESVMKNLNHKYSNLKKIQPIQECNAKQIVGLMNKNK